MAALLSRRWWLQQLEVRDDDDSQLTYIQSFLSNDDLRPVLPEKRTWAAWNYVTYWLADSFNINTWMIASSMIQLGLSWWQAWLCVWIGYGVVTPFLVLNARPGAVHHITFPVVARASFGLWGSLWCVFNRAAMACIWYGVQASIGGTCVLVMLRAMWPSVNNIPNSMPVSSGTNTRDFMCFFLFWLISLPAIWFPIHKIRHFFTLKAIVVPIAALTFFVWCIIKAHGVGPIVRQPARIHGSQMSWAMVVSFMSCISNSITLVTNAPDFASRARRPSDAVLPQLIGAPLCYGVVCFIGIIVSSSSEAIYGQPIWSPIDLLGMFLDGEPSHATRFGVWFIAVAFIIAQTIRRGGYIAAIVGLCMTPWNLLKSSNNFTTYLSAYSVFLSSIAGVMITDYYLVHKGHYYVKDLYSTDRSGWYWYTYGANLRAYAAYIAGISINVVGFAGATGRTVPLAATRIYELSFFTGMGVSGLVYWMLNQAFPARGAAKSFKEIDLSAETNDIESDHDFDEKSAIVDVTESIASASV
ncbi:uncharacterized protein FIBRA_01224 [Fibroporia radiculosa]|uniref:Uracil permease n=1 Tax=Fibroporia radiculosa TaxID=599839 RepID=J4H0Z5_9APHY|nr:uncharacterized protein FIBRA_01224 [Fibroporia radiculosa]CCL99209.1 predicted protein [Fibroporia radiculosa]